MNEVVRAFHQLYYGSPETTWANTRWLGVRAQKRGHRDFV